MTPGDIERVAATRRAIERAVAEHGAPNHFYPGELAAEYNAAPAMAQGRLSLVIEEGWPPEVEPWNPKGFKVQYIPSSGRNFGSAWKVEPK